MCIYIHMDFDHPLNCMTFNVQRAARSLVRDIEAAFKDTGLTAPQFSTLALLSGFGSQTVGQLADRLGTERTTLTRNLAVLAQKGWIAPVSSPDARLHAYDITEEGRAQLRAAMPAWRAFQQDLVARLGAEPSAALLTLLRSL